jgi:hypothetical protein
VQIPDLLPESFLVGKHLRRASGRVGPTLPTLLLFSQSAF